MDNIQNKTGVCGSNPQSPTIFPNSLKNGSCYFPMLTILLILRLILVRVHYRFICSSGFSRSGREYTVHHLIQTNCTFVSINCQKITCQLTMLNNLLLY